MDQALRPLAAQAISHWKSHLPEMYARLKAAGTLEATALQAVRQTMDEKVNLMNQGIPEDAAWEMVREQYLFRPEEPGASPEAPPSSGYRDQLEINRLLSNLGNEDQ